MLRRDVFHAIADPTRREIIQLIAHQSLNLNAVADNFTMSRPAISQHIKILTECGLITIRKQGRERFCEAKLKKLKDAYKWLAHFEVFWDNKLDDLGRHLDITPNS